MKKWLSNIAAFLWFIGVLVWILLLMPIIILMLPSDISTIIKSGFGTQTIGFIFLMMIGLVVGITMLVPAFRNCFRKLPWLYPYVTILTADIAIIAIAEELLNYGYSVQSETRHTIFLIIHQAHALAKEKKIAIKRISMLAIVTMRPVTQAMKKAT
mgnify:CR=1 FL=1